MIICIHFHVFFILKYKFYKSKDFVSILLLTVPGTIATTYSCKDCVLTKGTDKGSERTEIQSMTFTSQNPEGLFLPQNSISHNFIKDAE